MDLSESNPGKHTKKLEHESFTRKINTNVHYQSDRK